MTNALNWFEIPVTNMSRAKAFYSKVLGGDLPTQNMGEDGTMSILPYQEGVGGALVHNETWNYKPSQEGTIVYLNGGQDLSVALGKVNAAGGKVLVDKMGIGENGFIAFFLDTEGNKVGLHSVA
jgi:predicted enzyme related to lactoylglutathione lyase